MTCRPARRAACRYFVYSVVQKRVFRPQGRQTPLINMGSGDKFHVYRCRNVGIHYPRSSTFGTLPTQLPLEGNSFAQFFFYKILSICTHLYSFYIFNLVAFVGQTTKLQAFSLDENIFPQIFKSHYQLDLKVGGSAKWDGPPLSSCQFGGDRRPVTRRLYTKKC